MCARTAYRGNCLPVQHKFFLDVGKQLKHRLGVNNSRLRYFRAEELNDGSKGLDRSAQLSADRRKNEGERDWTTRALVFRDPIRP